MLLWPFLPSVSRLLPPSWACQWGEPAAWCQLVWPKGAERGQRRRGEEIEQYSCCQVNMHCIHNTTLYLPPLSPSLCLSLSPPFVYCFPSLLFSPQPVCGSLQISHRVTKMLTSNSFHFLGKHTQVYDLSHAHTHTFHSSSFPLSFTNHTQFHRYTDLSPSVASKARKRERKSCISRS